MYEQGQQFLLPPGLEELLPAGHFARPVSEVTGELNVESMLRNKIPGGGASRYHPEMFAKVFTCGYMNRTCSCRLLAKALRENERNWRIIRRRIVIEHVNAVIKVFRIFAYPYRNHLRRHLLRMSLVCGIINFGRRSRG